MIYLDNAATTMQKPPEVGRAILQALESFGGAGRGAHEASLDAGTTVFRARRAINELLDGPSLSRVAFGYNITEALNIVISGMLRPGDHAITTAASHNSVLRPLFRKQDEQGVELSVLPVSPRGEIDYDEFDALFRENTRLAVVTHASNVTGDVYDIARMADIAHRHHALLVVDAAQTAGCWPLSMARDGLDIVCFTGHKSLYGPQGTGGLCVAEGVEIPPFKVGGTGVHSYDRQQPREMPDRLEAGTINAHGIAGLEAGVSFILKRGVASIQAHIRELTQRLDEGLRTIDGVVLYGARDPERRCGIVAMNLEGVDAGEVADELFVRYGICTRAGAHCAPLMHEALGTADQGIVRFSIGSFNTEGEIDEAIAAVSELASDFGA